MPLTSLEIKIEIMKRGDTIASLARRWKCWDNDIHRVVQRTPGRALPEVRRKLARYLRVPIAEIGRDVERKPKKARAA
jgi:hypothetical protein